MNNHLNKLTLSALFLALCFVLPVITGNLTAIGNMLLPMHVPVLLCGFLCGWQYGLIIGAAAPILRSIMFAMPPMFPVAVPMAFELAVYGLTAGLFYKIFPKKNVFIYVSLTLSMILGRLVWGFVRYIMTFAGTEFSLKMFIAGAITNALPGILIQLVLIPFIVMAVKYRGIAKKAVG